jgi:predicted transcriptional regulator
VTHLGELEHAVMDVLWNHGAPAPAGLTVRDVAEALHGRGLADTTVMTVLDRLALEDLT